MGKKYPYQKINSKQAYSVKELTMLLCVHEQTIRKLWKDEGLKPMKNNAKPLLYWGKDIKTFLKDKENNTKFNTGFYEFPCMKCQKAIMAKDNIVYLIKNANGSYSLKAFCPICHSRINKFIAKKDIESVGKHYDIKPLEEMRIYETDCSSEKTHLDRSVSNIKKESSKKHSKTSLNNTDISNSKTHIAEQLNLF